MEESASGVSVLATTVQHVTEDVSAKDLAPPGIEVPGNVGDTSNLQNSSHEESELVSENHVRSVETPETQAFQEATGSSALNLDVHDKEAAYETPVLRPCSSIQDNPDVIIHGFSRAIAVDGRDETANLGLSKIDLFGYIYRDSCQILFQSVNILLGTYDELLSFQTVYSCVEYN